MTFKYQRQRARNVPPCTTPFTAQHLAAAVIVTSRTVGNEDNCHCTLLCRLDEAHRLAVS